MSRRRAASGRYTLRDAVTDDLAVIVALTQERRAALSRWAPTWWAEAEAADELHPLWLAHLIDGGATGVFIVEADASPIACACFLDQETQFFTDDLAIRSGHETGVVGALVGSTRALRPALTCVPTQDEGLAAAFSSAGAQLVSTYWLIETTDHAVEPGPFVDTDAVRPAHTFGGRPFDPRGEGALAFSTEAGSCIGSPSLAAPPVYDPGGTVAVADHVSGPDLEATLKTARDAAGHRGDVLLNVVCDADDLTLASALAQAGFQRTVEVYALPG